MHSLRRFLLYDVLPALLFLIAFMNIAPPGTKTYGSQSTMLFKVKGSRKTSVIYMGDIWDGQELWKSRYLWMPLDIGKGKLVLPEPKPWSIDVSMGITRTP